jgi:iron complex outermembrane receptor protein
VLSGETLNGIETAGVRATLTFDGAGPWRADVMADFGQDRSGMTAHEGLGLFAPESLGGDPSSVTRCSNDRAARNECVNLLGYRYSSDPYSEAFDRSGREYLDVGGVSVSVARSGVIDVHAITSYRTAAREVLEDTDASPLSIVALDFDNESEVFTQELLFQGQYGRLDWSTGVFFLNESLSTENRFDTLGTLRGVGVGFIDDPALFAFGPFRLEQVYSQDTRSHAVFGEIDWAATSALTLTAGLRLTTERTKFATETRFDEVTAMPVLSPLRQASQTDDAASWRLAGRYAFTPERSIYASVSRGFKSGGFNGGALFPSDSIGPVAPEFVTAYEAGAQWRLSDRVGLEASVFRYDYTDLQDFTLQAAPPPTRQVLDSADAEMLGADVRVETRLPSGFTAAAGASLLDATFVDFVDANGVDRSGNRLTAAPEVSALLSLDWQAQLTPIWFARANLNLKHRSEIFFDNSNDALLKSKDATLTDMTFNLEHRPAQVTVSVSVRNLTNEAVVVDALNIAEYGFIQQTYAPPRTVFVELRKRL